MHKEIHFPINMCSFVYSSLNVPAKMHDDAYDVKMYEKGGSNQPLKI